jgi:hypothetical protein
MMLPAQKSKIREVSMNRLSILLSCLLIVCIAPVFATPPSALTASYDGASDLLNVSFTHKVDNNSSHYISEVVILKNKKEIIRQELSYQDTLEGGTLVFKINDIKPKDKLDITATCVMYGKKTYSLVFK